MPRTTPITDIAKSERLKKAYQTNPEFYTKVCNHNKTFGNLPEEKERRSQRMKEVWARPGYKETKIKRGRPRKNPIKIRVKKGTEEFRQLISQKRKVYWDTLPDDKRKELIKKLHTPKRKRKSWSKERRKKASEKMKRVYCEKNLADQQRQKMLGENNPNWRGGISCHIQYCEKFNKDFKRRCRAYFNHTCVECGTPENGHGHICHHVNYDKQICCNETKPLFVLLCFSCHGKTNYDRNIWQQHFTNITEKYYESKCFFSKEEYKQFTCG